MLYLCLDEAFIFLSCHTFWVNSPLCMSYVSFVFCWFGRGETFLLSHSLFSHFCCCCWTRFFSLLWAASVIIRFLWAYILIWLPKSEYTKRSTQTIYRSVVNLNSLNSLVFSCKYLLLIPNASSSSTRSSESWLAKVFFKLAFSFLSVRLNRGKKLQFNKLKVFSNSSYKNIEKIPFSRVGFLFMRSGRLCFFPV